MLPASAVVGRSILEVGSFNVNGSPRDWIEPLGPSEYIGIDLEPQERYVDVVLPRKRPSEAIAAIYGLDRFDIVVSAEMLEHAEHWRDAIRSMKTVLKVGGKLVLTCRGPGFPRHDYPSDYWRFTVEDMRRIMDDMTIDVLIDDPTPGVLLCATKTDQPPADLDAINVQAAP
jgi:SAM-dependent methyltransferase